MSEKIKSEAISRRRAFSLLGLGAALSLAVPTLLTVSDAEAETVGMERRHERREHRRERRHERRERRHERRHEQHEGH
jgi:Ni/Co efflux regulator RcnB